MNIEIKWGRQNYPHPDPHTFTESCVIFSLRKAGLIYEIVYSQYVK